MEAIRRAQIRDTLRGQGTGKARGVDGWGPAELALLPDAWLDALGCIHGPETEWPKPKKGCGLQGSRPMCAGCGWRYRRGSRNVGHWTYTKGNMEARICETIQVARFQGKHTCWALLDCSKCYECVWHSMAWDRAVASRLQAKVAKHDLRPVLRGHTHQAPPSSRDASYGEPQARGGVRCRQGHSEAFMATVKKECPGGEPRGCIDDLALCVRGWRHGGRMCSTDARRARAVQIPAAAWYGPQRWHTAGAQPHNRN